MEIYPSFPVLSYAKTCDEIWTVQKVFIGPHSTHDNNRQNHVTNNVTTAVKSSCDSPKRKMQHKSGRGSNNSEGITYVYLIPGSCNCLVWQGMMYEIHLLNWFYVRYPVSFPDSNYRMILPDVLH